MRSYKTLCIMAVIGLVLGVFGVSNAHATLFGTVPTLPGDTVVPGLVASGTAPGTFLAELSVPYTATLGSPAGTLYSAVYRETFGTLDFYYQVTNLDTSKCGGPGQGPCDPIARETDVRFTGFLTSTGFRLDGGSFGGPFVAGTVTPVTADRNSVGDVVGYSFNPPDSSKVQPGHVSSVLIVSTNATNFGPGDASIIDGSTDTVVAFEPVSAVPEPGSLLLLGSGIIGMISLRRARR